MTSEPFDPRSTAPVRALFGESVGLVTGMTFISDEVLQCAFSDRAAAAGALGVDFAFVPSSESRIEEAIAELAEAGVAAFVAVDGPFARAALELGWTEAIRTSASEPETLRNFLDAGVALALVSWKRAISAGGAGLVVADDLAGASGPLVAPDFANEELAPRLETLVREAQKVKLPAIFHSDGDLRAFLPALARTGFSAVHGGGPDERTFLTLLREARRYGLRVVGGMGSAELCAGPHAADDVGSRADLLAAPGDVLVADDGGIATREQFEAFSQALAAVHDSAV